MRRFLPDVASEDLEGLYLDLDLPRSGPGRPYVYLGMVASLDGAAAVEGRTGALGGPADRQAFRRLRESCDVILVGATTVRAEGYGPPRPDAATRERRVAAGRDEVPTLAVVSASLRLDPSSRLFGDPQRRPVVLTTEDADPHQVEQLAPRADVVRAGRGRVDLGAALRLLGERGAGRVLCEGGPALNGQLLAAGLVDEVFLTLVPAVVGTALSIVEGTVGGAPLAARLVELHEHEGELLLRYRLRAR